MSPEPELLGDRVRRAAGTSRGSRDIRGGVSRPGGGSRGSVRGVAADRPGYVPAAPVFAAKLSRCSGILCPAIRRVRDRASMGRVPSEGRARGQPAARSECGVGVGRSCRDPGAGVPWGSTDSLHFVPDRDPDQDPSGSGPCLSGSRFVVPYGWRGVGGEEGAAKGRNVVLTHLSRDKLPGTRGEVPGSSELRVASDSRAPFPFEVKGRR